LRIGQFRNVWRKKILVEKFLVENFLSVEPGSGHKAKIFGISGNMFFSRIGPFRIVWRKKIFFVNILAGRHEIVPPEPSSGSNISGSWKGIDVRFSSAAHKVCFALSDQKLSKSVLYFLRFSPKTSNFDRLRGFYGARDFFSGWNLFPVLHINLL